MSKRLSRRALLTGTGSALTAALLAACSTNQATQAPSGASAPAPTQAAPTQAASVPTDAASTQPDTTSTQPAQGKKPLLNRMPYLQNLTTTGVVISWQPKKQQASWLRIGPTGGELRQIDAPEGKNTRIAVDDLQPNTSYDYEVGVGDTAQTQRFTFRSAPSNDVSDFSFVVFGDSGEDTPVQHELAARMLELKPDLALHTGDVVYGQPAHFDQRYFGVYADMLTTTTVFPAIGDNDANNDDGQPFLRSFVLPPNAPANGKTRAYSFDYGTAHFIALDTEVDFDEKSAQYRWLENDLANTTQPWKFVYFHRPTYSADEDRTHNHIRKAWCPLFEQYNVSAVFSGHDHNYQRTKPVREFSKGPGGVVYIISGGGGAELREVEMNDLTAFTQAVHHVVQMHVHGDTATIRAVKADGSILDEATINRQG